MSISALPVTTRTPAGAVTTAGLFSADLPITADGLPIDFATLLGGQLAQIGPSGVSVLTGAIGEARTPTTPSEQPLPDTRAGLTSVLTGAISEAHTPTIPSEQPLPDTHAELTTGLDGHAPNVETLLTTQANQPDRLAGLVNPKKTDTVGLEESPGNGLEQARLNALSLTSTLGHSSALATDHSAEGVLSMIASQITSKRDDLKKRSEETLTNAVPLADSVPPDSLARLINLRVANAVVLEKSQGNTLEQASLNALPLASTQGHSSAVATDNSAEGVLSMITSQATSKQEDSKKWSEASIDPSLMAQALPPYQNAPLEIRPTIDVDRNKQSKLNPSADSVFSEKSLSIAQSNPELKPSINTNLNPSLASSPEPLKANADLANLATPVAGTGNSPSPAFSSILTNQTPNASQASVAPPTVSSPIQDSRWPHEFSDRIVWIAKNDQQVAQINITPAQLGPVQITVNINGDQASINFASPHAEVRKAIEDAMPNLREMLASSGISLGQSNVGSQLQQQQRELPGQFTNGTRAAGENAILPADSRSGSSSSSLPIQRGRGLVDLFA